MDGSWNRPIGCAAGKLAAGLGVALVMMAVLDAAAAAPPAADVIAQGDAGRTVLRTPPLWGLPPAQSEALRSLDTVGRRELYVDGDEVSVVDDFAFFATCLLDPVRYSLDDIRAVSDIDSDGDVDADDLASFLLASTAPITDRSDPGSTGDPWANTHEFTGFPMTDDGWTDFLALVQHQDYFNDARVVYVSSSGGSDSTGITYDIDSATIGDDPFKPTGAIRPYATLATAYAELRDGYPDLMLLKRGDTWATYVPDWRKSGRQRLEPIILGAYGPEGTARPVVTSVYTGSAQGPVLDFVVFTSIEFTGPGEVAIFRGNGGDGFLIEDVLIPENESTGLTCQSQGGVPLKNIAIRRCVIHDRYPIGAYCQGIYAADVQNLLIEECVLDHNGWSETVPGADATWFSHNAYLQTSCTNVKFRGNVTARGAGDGLSQRPGGENEDNLCLQNPIIGYGYSSAQAEGYPPVSGFIRNNVILDSRDIDASTPRGTGLRVSRLKGVEIYGNVIAHQRTGTGNIRGFSFGHHGVYQSAENITIRDNVVYQWEGNVTSYAMLIESPTTVDILNMVIRDNRIQQSDQLIISVPTEDLGEISVSGNSYYSSDSRSFRPGFTFPEWTSQVDDTGSVFAQYGFPDPDRDIQTYMASIGYDIDQYQESLEQFLLEVRKQRRGYWRPAFTSDVVNAYIREGFGMPAEGFE